MNFNLNRKLHARSYKLKSQWERKDPAYWLSDMPRCGYSEECLYADNEDDVTCKGCKKKLIEDMIKRM